MSGTKNWMQNSHVDNLRESQDMFLAQLDKKLARHNKQRVSSATTTASHAIEKQKYRYSQFTTKAHVIKNFQGRVNSSISNLNFRED